MSFQLPCTLDGRYEVQRRIGSGGMGEVYVARHLGLDRDVAVKLLATTAADPTLEERVRERFRREAVALSRLRHPNTVQVIDFGWTAEQRPYIITELLTGDGLEKILAGGPLPPDRALNLLLQICRSLAEAHQHGIVHRDLKPSNVIVMQAVGTDDFVKVIDFGVARVDSVDSQQRARPLTVEGTTLGTPEYMAPEQARGEKPSPATDVYALGCILYEMMAGRPPFAGESALQIMIKQIREEPPAFAEVLPDRPPPHPIEQLVRWCMRKAPAERPADAGVLVDEVRQLLTSLQQAAAAPERAPRARDRVAVDASDPDAGYRRPMALRRGRRRSGRQSELSVADEPYEASGELDEAPAPEPAPEPPSPAELSAEETMRDGAAPHGLALAGKPTEEDAPTAPASESTTVPEAATPARPRIKATRRHVETGSSPRIEVPHRGAPTGFHEERTVIGLRPVDPQPVEAGHGETIVLSGRSSTWGWWVASGVAIVAGAALVTWLAW